MNKYFLLGGIILYGKKKDRCLIFVLCKVFLVCLPVTWFFRTEYKSTRNGHTLILIPLTAVIRGENRSKICWQFFATAFFIVKNRMIAAIFAFRIRNKKLVHFVVNLQQKLLASKLPNWIFWYIYIFSWQCGN